MGSNETGNETVEAIVNNLIYLALRLEARGIPIDDKSLGTILYLQRIAHERDQINWACSAQSEKLLPDSMRSKKNTGAAALRAAVQRHVQTEHYSR